MRRLAGGVIHLLAGAAAGAFSAYLAIQNAGVEPVASGSPWLSRSAALSGTSGLYVRSHFLINGRLPPATGQVVESSAETDGDGQSLTASCIYVLGGTGPFARWWSLAVITGGSDGQSSQTIIDTDTAVREADGAVLITAAASPQPGNWLKLPPGSRFTLLYSAVPLSGQPASGLPPFSITRRGC